ncbi:MAG: hypothetical protein WC900_10060 [Oscillospiraceae bacterium]
MFEIKKVGNKAINDFLAVPKLIYTKKQLVQNESDEIKLLTASHVLSKYFIFTGFVCYKSSAPCGRCAVTLYPDTNNAYIGFFECIDDEKAAKEMMNCAEKFIVECGRSTVIGPVDASFWIKYRMKVSGFDKTPYFSEPYNMGYYQRLWECCGYKISQEYISNIYDTFTRKNSRIKKCKSRYERFTEKSYIIASPNKKDWEKTISDIYCLIMKLYSDFPVFAYLSENDFKELFAGFKTILDFSMVKTAYLNGVAAGFFIGIPDYKNRLYGKTGVFEILYLVLKKIRCSNYIFLYMGVDSGHQGLGNALTQTMIENAAKKRASAVGALIKKGKFTGNYAKERINGIYEYVLMEKPLNS